MKVPLLLILAVAGAYWYLNWQPSTTQIAQGMMVTDTIEFEGQSFHSEWSERVTEVEGLIRRKDRHYDANIPIITYDLAVATGDFRDPDIVEIRHKGGGNYFWSSKQKPKGSLIFYHVVPATPYVQTMLDALKVGDTPTLQGRISTNDRISSSSGAMVGLRHSNHKFILVDDLF